MAGAVPVGVGWQFGVDAVDVLPQRAAGSAYVAPLAAVVVLPAALDVAGVVFEAGYEVAGDFGVGYLGLLHVADASSVSRNSHIAESDDDVTEVVSLRVTA